jgi:hypothetical protein
VAIGIPHIARIPEQPGRILIDSLEGITVSKLQEIFEAHRG